MKPLKLDEEFNFKDLREPLNSRIFNSSNLLGILKSLSYSKISSYTKEIFHDDYNKKLFK